MNSDLKKFAEFFRKEGANDIGHSDITYLAHAMGVYRDLKSWGCDEELCHMAIFHSIYGIQTKKAESNTLFSIEVKIVFFIHQLNTTTLKNYPV